MKDLLKINRNTMFLLNQLSSLMFHGLSTLANLRFQQIKQQKIRHIFETKNCQKNHWKLSKIVLSNIIQNHQNSLRLVWLWNIEKITENFMKSCLATKQGEQLSARVDIRYHFMILHVLFPWKYYISLKVQNLLLGLMKC